jgi:polyhydroxyalkanoate synthesis repressor PhaR
MAKVTTIKKYANRRLYDTSSSCYITLEDLYLMVKKNIDFVVVDAKTDEDLTRQVLTQIIFEQESKGYNLLPVKFLRNIISFYGGKVQQFLPSYLEASMDNFMKNQDNFFDYFTKTPNITPFAQFEELSKQQMALFKTAFSMFAPVKAKDKD